MKKSKKLDILYDHVPVHTLIKGDSKKGKCIFSESYKQKNGIKKEKR